MTTNADGNFFYAATEMPTNVQVVNDSWIWHSVQLITLLVVVGRKFWECAQLDVCFEVERRSRKVHLQRLRGISCESRAPPNSSWVACVVTWPQTTRQIWLPSDDQLHSGYLPRSFKHVLNVRFLSCFEICTEPVCSSGGSFIFRAGPFIYSLDTIKGGIK